MNIIITGASSGIGEEILKVLLKENKILAISRTKIKIDNKNVSWIKADLSKKEELERLEKEIKDFKCDVLINNAGAGKIEDLEKLKTDELIDETVLNLICPIKLTQFVSENMKKNNFGRIINISSISGLNGTPYLFMYSASKAGLNNFTQSSAEYFRDYDITVNTICPGGVDTKMAIEGRKQISKMYNEKPEKHQQDMLRAMGRKDLISVNEVAKLVEFLIKMPSINGQCFNICGLIEK